MGIFHQRLSSLKGNLPSKVVFLQSLSSINGCLPSKVIFHQMKSSIKGCLPSKVVFLQSLSSIKGCPLSKFVFHWWLVSIRGCLPSKVVFHQRTSLLKVCLPIMAVFHQRLSSIKSNLPSKVFFPQRFPSIKDCLPSKVVFHQKVVVHEGCLQLKVVFHQRLYFINDCLNWFEIEVEGIGIEDWQSIFEDSIMPHQNSIHMFLFDLCRESLYFEDIVTFWIFGLRTIYNFFQVRYTKEVTQSRFPKVNSYTSHLDRKNKQAGAELGQAQHSLSLEVFPFSWYCLLSQVWMELEALLRCSSALTGMGE